MNKERFVVRHNFLHRFIVLTLFALILAISIVFGTKAIIAELSAPNRPLVVPVFERVEQDVAIVNGRFVFGDRTFIPIILKNTGRKPARNISWRFDLEGLQPVEGSRSEALGRRDSIAISIEKSPNPREQWGFGLLRYSLQYSDANGNTYFKNDSLLVHPLIGESDRRKLGNLGQIAQPQTEEATADSEAVSE